MIPLQVKHERVDEDDHIMPQQLLVICHMIHKLDNDFVDSAKYVDLLHEFALDEIFYTLFLHRLHYEAHHAVLRLSGHVGHVC